MSILESKIKYVRVMMSCFLMACAVELSADLNKFNCFAQTIPFRTPTMKYAVKNINQVKNEISFAVIKEVPESREVLVKERFTFHTVFTR